MRCEKRLSSIVKCGINRCIVLSFDCTSSGSLRPMMAGANPIQPLIPISACIKRIYRAGVAQHRFNAKGKRYSTAIYDRT